MLDMCDNPKLLLFLNYPVHTGHFSNSLSFSLFIPWPGAGNMYVTSGATTTAAPPKKLQKSGIIASSILFLFCTMTEEVADTLKSIFELEASGLFSFQKTRGEILEVCNFLYILFSRCTTNTDCMYLCRNKK